MELIHQQSGRHAGSESSQGWKPLPSKKEGKLHHNIEIDFFFFNMEVSDYNTLSYLELVISRFLEHYAVRFSLMEKILQVVNHPCEFY